MAPKLHDEGARAMPFQPTAFMESRYTHDLPPDRAVELAQGFGQNSKTTVYVLERQEGDPGVGDGSGVLVGDFPIGATLTAIVTPMGTITRISPPFTLSAADVIFQQRAAAGEAVALIHWRKEGGIYRVIPMATALFASLTPKLDTWITLEGGSPKKGARR